MSITPFNFPLANNKLPFNRGFDGTQEIRSIDNSIFRIGSFSTLTTGSATTNIYGVCGNTAAMIAYYHNFDIDSNGNFMGRDENDSCTLYVHCENNTFKYFGAPSANKGTLPVFTLYKTIDLLTGNTTYVGAIIPSQTVGITGTTTNNNANAGAVGEVISATIATPGTTLTTTVSANVIATPFLSLTAGDWDVWGQIAFLPGATTSITQLAFGISATSATLPTAGSGGLVQNTMPAFIPTAINQCDNVTMTRVSIASTTPYYLVAAATFTASTLSAFGTLYARRVR